MAARSLWNGTIVFGAVTVPIKLHTAADSRTIHFHEVHLADGARIEHRRFCSKEDREAPKDEIVRGYEDADVPGRSSMSKKELVGALNREP